jgi:hypothetical protein
MDVLSHVEIDPVGSKNRSGNFGTLSANGDSVSDYLSGVDGIPQPFENANGQSYRNAVVKMKGGKLNANGDVFRNCAPCAAMAALAADGQPYRNAVVKMKGGYLNATGDLNWVRIALFVGAGFLVYKYFLK